MRGWAGDRLQWGMRGGSTADDSVRSHQHGAHLQLHGPGPIRQPRIRERPAHFAHRRSDGGDRWASEKHLCDAWEAGLNRGGGRSLMSEDGSAIAIVDSGVRNSGDGPDFLGAVIAIETPEQGTRLVRGDVEMHLKAADWFAHGHDMNAAFASVILHVVEDARGLSKIAGAPVVEIRPSPNRRGRRKTSWGYAKGGRLHEELRRRGRGRDTVADVLGALGDARLEERAAALEGDIVVAGAEQALYEALLRGLGYTRNMTAFQEVARLLPIQTLRGLTEGAPGEEARTARLAGLLFGTAGLLPSQSDTPNQGALFAGAVETGGSGSGHVTDAYTSGAEAGWAALRGLESLPHGSWQTFRVRPDNHPIRRMGVAVELMRRWLAGPGFPADVIRAVTGEKPVREVIACLLETVMVPPIGYWAMHRGFCIERRGTPTALLGRGRALDMLATAVLPFLLAVADLESHDGLAQRTREVYAALPNSGASGAARRARDMLREDGDGTINHLSARRYQGFLSWMSGNSQGASREPLPLFEE